MDKKRRDEFGTLEYAEDLGKQYADMSYDSFKQSEDYSGLKKGYEMSGQKAMKDTIAQMAAKTGGMASSYAQTAGQQAYGDWMTRLEDAAYSMYGAQKNDILNQYTLAKDAYSTRKALSDEETLKNKNNLMNLFAIGNTLDTVDYAGLGISDEDAKAYWTEYEAGEKGKRDEENKAAFVGLLQQGHTPDEYTDEQLAQMGITRQQANNWYNVYKGGMVEKEEQDAAAEETETENLIWHAINGLGKDELTDTDINTIASEFNVNPNVVKNQYTVWKSQTKEQRQAKSDELQQENETYFYNDVISGNITEADLDDTAVDENGKTKLQNYMDKYNLTERKMRTLIAAANVYMKGDREEKDAAQRLENMDNLYNMFTAGDYGINSTLDLASLAGTYNLEEIDVANTYNRYLANNMDRFKSEEEQAYAQGLADFENDLHLGLVKRDENTTDEMVASNYGISVKDLNRITKAYDILMASQDEESIYQMSGDEILDMMEMLFDMTVPVAYKQSYLDMLKANGYITKKQAAELLDSVKSEIG